MDFAFYNADPPSSALGRVIRPCRRLVRRLLRPYFYSLRDLLASLFHHQQEQIRRVDELSARIDAVDAAVRLRSDADQTPLRPQAFTADYLALTRRLARLEDLLIELHSHVPSTASAPAAAAPAMPGPDLEAILRRLDAIEEALAQLTAASQLDGVLPLYSEAQRRQVS